jgi:hypothetical protein
MKKLNQKSTSGVFSYSVYFYDKHQKTCSMSDKYTLNLTIATCKYLTNRNFQNIVIDLAHEPYLNERPKLLIPRESIHKFYVVGERRKDDFRAFYTNSIIDILTFINENMREDSERYQVIQIVNCIPMK